MINPLRHLVVGVRSLEPLDPVLPLAVEVARSVGGTLHVVHTYEYDDAVLEGYSRLGHATPLAVEHFVREQRASLQAALVRIGAPDAVVHVTAGGPGRTLREVAERVRAGLVIIGSTHRGRIGRQVLGTTAERCLRDSLIPVLLLQRPIGPEARVLFPTDLSDIGDFVYRAGRELAEKVCGDRRVDRRALLVVDPDHPLHGPEPRDVLQQEAHESLDRFLAGHADGQGAVESRVCLGDPPETILHEADHWHADLVVMGTHGRRGWSRLMFGSVAGAVMREARTNVLVVPALAPAVEFSGQTAQIVVPGIAC